MNTKKFKSLLLILMVFLFLIIFSNLVNAAEPTGANQNYKEEFVVTGLKPGIEQAGYNSDTIQSFLNKNNKSKKVVKVKIGLQKDSKGKEYALTSKPNERKTYEEEGKDIKEQVFYISKKLTIYSNTILELDSRITLVAAGTIANDEDENEDENKNPIAQMIEPMRRNSKRRI